MWLPPLQSFSGKILDTNVAMRCIIFASSAWDFTGTKQSFFSWKWQFWLFSTASQSYTFLGSEERLFYDGGSRETGSLNLLIAACVSPVLLQACWKSCLQHRMGAGPLQAAALAQQHFRQATICCLHTGWVWPAWELLGDWGKVGSVEGGQWDGGMAACLLQQRLGLGCPSLKETFLELLA